VVSEVVEAEVTEGSETTLVGSSDFDQWYSSHRDTILAIWSNAISGLDLNDSTVDQTAALSQLWNETLRSLYGAELPWDGETVVGNDVVMTEDTVLADQTVGDSVVEEVITSWASLPDGEVTTDSETTLTEGRDIDQIMQPIASRPEEVVTNSRDFDQWDYSDGEALGKERVIAINDEIIEDVEQVEEQIEIANLSLERPSTSVPALNMMSNIDVAMDRIPQFGFGSERLAESDLTGASSDLSNEFDEASVQESGDRQIATSSRVLSASLFVNEELEVLDECFENLSFL
jgi:hypothetical protein